MGVKHSLRGVFVVGTSTGVGKTFFSCLVCCVLQDLGVCVQPRKPIESGVDDMLLRARTSDAGLLQKAVSGRVSLDEICRYPIPYAISPKRACEICKKHVSLHQLTASCQVSPQEFVVVEGAGGILSPIAEDGNCADLVSLLELPCIVVAPNHIGCINHVLLTMEALRARCLKVLAVVLNATAPIEDTLYDSELELAEYLDVTLCKIPFCNTSKDKMHARAQVAKLASLLLCTDEVGKHPSSQDSGQ